MAPLGRYCRHAVYLAYDIGLGPNRILGLPSWNDKTRFDIEAGTSAATVPKPQFEAMLQAILRDRFHFVAHVESRPMRAYVLTAPAGDGKLLPATGDCVPFGAPWSIGALYCEGLGLDSVGSLAGALALGTPDAKGLTHLKARSITVADLTDFLPRGTALPEDQVPVADETGISRKFDLDLAYKFSRPRRDQGRDQYDSDVDANFREFRKALLEQTGLALSARPVKAPLPVVVIDRVTLPTPNLGPSSPPTTSASVKRLLTHGSKFRECEPSRPERILLR